MKGGFLQKYSRSTYLLVFEVATSFSDKAFLSN